MRKKAQVDLIYILAGLFTLGVIIFVVLLMLNKVSDSGIYDDYDTSAQIHAVGRLSILNFDNIMLFILIGLSLFVIISAAFVWNHPAFIIIGLILLAIVITVAGVISNAWVDFTDESTIGELTASLPKVHFLMQRLPFYMLFMGVAAMIAMAVGYRSQYG